MTTTTGTLTAIPTDQAALEELIGDQKRVTEVIKSGQFGEVIQNYARNVAKQDMDIKVQVSEQVQATLADFLRENGQDISRPDLAVRAVASPAGDARNSLYNPRAMGTILDKDYQGPTAAADFFSTIWHHANKTVDIQAKLNRIRNAFSSTVPSEGGFLIPETLRSELLRVALEQSIVRQRARVIPMETLRVPFPAIDSTSNVSSVYGGIVTYWTEEGAALTESSASFGRIVLDAKKLTAYTLVPNELISDSIGSFQAYLDQMFPEAMGFGEDYAFMQGNGAGEPLGFLNSGNTALVTVSKETNQAADTIVWENIVKMYARMLPGSLNRAVWLVSPDAFPQLATMALAVGTGGSAVWLSNGQASAPTTILGRPVIVTEKVSKIGDLGDISFVDLGFYLIGDRQVMSAMSSPHYKFANDQTAYRITERVDGRPWIQSPITPKNNSATLSAFVQLEAR